MKATKKIVGAACALVAAVALSAGSTFAWFVTNGNVTATGMQIDVNTNNSYLIISEDAAKLRTDNSSNKTITLAKATGESALLPAAHCTVDTTASDTGAINEHKVLVNDLVNASSWYTAEGTSTTDGTLKTASAIEAGDFSKYVLVDEIYVSVSTGSDDVSAVYMTVENMDSIVKGNAATAESKSNEAVSIVILYRTQNEVDTSGNATAEYDMVELNSANGHALTGGKLNIGGVTDTTHIQLQVMVYFDGNNQYVNGSMAKKLTGLSFGLKFSDTDPSPAP